MGLRDRAVAAYEQAIALATNEAERRFLVARLEAERGRGGGERGGREK
jgi:predicted RNA polymerase sigma factor